MADVAVPQEVELSIEAQTALLGVAATMSIKNPLQAGAIKSLLTDVKELSQKLPAADRQKMIAAINANPQKAAIAISDSVTDASGTFVPAKATAIHDKFPAFASQLATNLAAPAIAPVIAAADATPSVPTGLAPAIDTKMHAQLAKALNDGTAANGLFTSPLSAQESSWLADKQKDPAFMAAIAKESMDRFKIDQTAGTYDEAAFQRFIENPQRYAYESAKSAEHKAATPDPTAAFTAVASDPAKSPALAAFEKKLGDTRPDLKKQYDAFAAGHAEFRGNMAQILSDVPEMADAAIANPELLKVAMEDSQLAAKKIREGKDEIRKPENLALLPLAGASDIRSKLGMPTPAGAEDGTSQSGEMIRSIIMMIGQFLTKMCPSLGPYVEQFADMGAQVGDMGEKIATKLGVKASALLGINDPAAVSTGDKPLKDDAVAAVTPDAKPVDPGVDPAVIAANEQRFKAKLPAQQL